MSTTPVVSTWKKEFDERLSAFAETLGVPLDQVQSKLSEYGADGSSAHSLDMIESEDTLPMAELFAMFVDSGLAPKGRLRLAVPHLRGKTHLTTETQTVESDDSLKSLAGSIQNLVASNRPKSDWTDEELLRQYDEDATEIAEVLRQRTHGRPCIVFNRDQSVNIEASLKLIRIAKRQQTSNQFMWQDKPVRVFRAGEFLAKPVDESPFCPGVALIDGYCPESDTQWTGIDQRRRVLVRIYVRDVETGKLNKTQMKAICKDARKDDDDFENEYAAAVLRYEELEQQDKLPTLKIMPSAVNSSAKAKDSGFGQIS